MCSSNGTNRVVDISTLGGPLSAGNNVQIWTEIDPMAQQFSIIPLGQNQFRISPKANGAIYFAAYGDLNGTAEGRSSTSAGNVYLSDYIGEMYQHWMFELIGTTSSEPYGVLESVTSSSISGWTWRSDMPNTPLQVHIYVENTATNAQWIYYATADQYRADLVAAGKGNGYHGFSYNINWADYPYGQYRVVVFAIGGTNPPLVNSPTFYTHSAPSTPSTPVALTLNNAYTFTSNVTPQIFTFTAPETGTYMIETYGSADTSGTVGVNINGTIVNDNNNNDGVGNNFCIDTYLENGQVANITVNNAQSGTTIKVHRARMQIYTFDYGLGDIDTRIDAILPRTGLSALGYNVSDQSETEFKSYSHPNELGIDGFKNMNCDVVYFSGHGLNPTYNRNSALVFYHKYENGQYDTQFLYPHQLPTDMSNVKLALWNSCYSGIQEYNGETCMSVAETAYNNGAKVSIGWKTKICTISTSVWSNAFFYYLCESDPEYQYSIIPPAGMTFDNNVEMAIRYANAYLLNPNDTVLTQRIVFGDQTTIIRPVLFFGDVNLNYPQPHECTLDDLERIRTSPSEFVSYDILDNGTRYVRVINNIPTDEFYDVYNDGMIICSKTRYSEEDLLNIKNISVTNETETRKNNILKSIAVSDSICKPYELYCKINGEIKHIFLYGDDTNELCIDLTTGQHLSVEMLYGGKKDAQVY